MKYLSLILSLIYLQLVILSGVSVPGAAEDIAKAISAKSCR